MKILVLSAAEVRALLPPLECIEAVESVLADLSRGTAVNPLRSLLRPEGARGLMGLMPSYRAGDRAAFGLKEICFFAENTKRGLDSHLGAVLLHSAETGQLLALMPASAITALRRAAVSALATRLLAREEARTLAVIGAGVQAAAHIPAISAVRAIEQIRIASRDIADAQRLAAKHGIADAVTSVEEAVRGADIIVTATSSREPVLRAEWIAPGAHINLVGSSVKTDREADGATMAAGSLFVDRRESTVNESGDYLFALREGAIGEDAIRAEIGEILTGQHHGRTSDEEITIFKSLGLAVEDLAAAQHLYERAKREGAGQWVEFE